MKSFIHDEIRDWSKYLQSGEDTNIVEAIRTKTRLGQPYGDEGFLNKLEKKLGMDLSRQKRSRTRKEKTPQGGK
jgi:hypothetical protein